MVNKYSIATLLSLVVLAGYFLYPALFLDQSLVHVDNLIHGYPLLHFHHQVVSNGLSPFWTDLVYGGHPLFAEAQAGLSNPLNILTALLFAPEFGHNLLHYLAMILLGMGTYGLCRSLSIDRAAAMFGALASSFSGLALYTNSNLTGMEAMAVIPWALWGFESWLRTPKVKQAILFGLAMAYLILAGYPHFFHGTVLYMLVSMVTVPFEKRFRDNRIEYLKRYVSTGAIAVLICASVAAIQWIPLLELVNFSHRRDGTELLFSIPADTYIRGFIYSVANPKPYSYFPIVGSLLVCMLASAVLLFSTSARIRGHLLGVFLLVNLGFAQSSPLYNFLLEYRLLPGLGNFRIMFPYFHIAFVGICVLAAMTIHQLSRGMIREVKLWVITLFGVIWCLLVYRYHYDEAPLTNYVVTVLAIAASIILIQVQKQIIIPVACCLLLIIEIVTLKIDRYTFVANNILRTTPKTVQLIQQGNNPRDFKHLSIAYSTLAFVSPYKSQLEKLAAMDLNQIHYSTNLLWGLPSFNGAFALGSRRRALIEKHIENEIIGRVDTPPGLRIIDILSIKYVTTRGPLKTPGFVKIMENKLPALMLMDNTAALPKFQAYTRVIQTESPEAALAALQAMQERTLVIDNPTTINSINDTIAQNKPDIRFELLHDEATDYLLETSSGAPFWLFLADANYPGWRAEISGEDTPVYSAQILGKAIRVPAGKQKVRVYFRSGSVMVGAVITATALAIIACYCLFGLFKRCQRLSQLESINQ